MRISSRDLLHTSTEDIWRFYNRADHDPKCYYDVEFDDGIVVAMSGRQIILSRYIWEPLTFYPEQPIKAYYAYTHTHFGPTSHLDILEKIIFEIIDMIKLQGIEPDTSELGRMCYLLVTNKIFNHFSIRLAPYVSTTRLEDYIEIVEHPFIKPKLEHLYRIANPSPLLIEETYNFVKKAMESNELFPSNPIARAVRAGNTKAGSILQSIVSRGTPTDIDSRIFSKTIKTGYLRGIQTLVDQLMDSRTSAKSLSYQSKPMQDSEYLNRKLQISSGTLVNIHRTDCGTTRYIPATIKPGYLTEFLGKRFFDEASQSERVITNQDTHLQGRTIKLRSVFSCIHPDANGVCSACIGELATSIPKYTILGHQMSINLQGPVGQLLLSDKHFVSTATGDGYYLGLKDREFFALNPNDSNLVMFSPKLHAKSLKFRMMPHEVMGVNDIAQDINLNDLSIFRVSEITFIELTGEDTLGRQMYHDFIVSNGTHGHRLSFSVEALAHIQGTGYTLDDDGNYIFDFTHFDMTKPLLILPRKQVTTVDYMKSIDKFTRGEGSKELPSMVDYGSIPASLMAFHDIVSERMTINIANLEVILLAHSARDRAARDYRLPADKSKAELAKYNDIMNYRSLSAKLAYQGHVKIMFSESAFNIKNRPSHPLDPILMGKYNGSVNTQI